MTRAELAGQRLDGPAPARVGAAVGEEHDPGLDGSHGQRLIQQLLHVHHVKRIEWRNGIVPFDDRSLTTLGTVRGLEQVVQAEGQLPVEVVRLWLWQAAQDD